MDMVALFTAVAAALCHALLKRFWVAVVISAMIGVALFAVLSFAAGHFGWSNPLFVLALFAFACGVSAAIGLLMRQLKRSGESGRHGL
jgi:hypothetical protein